MNSAVVHCTLQGFIARLVVRADKGRRAVWTMRMKGVLSTTRRRNGPSGVCEMPSICVCFPGAAVLSEETLAWRAEEGVLCEARVPGDKCGMVRMAFPVSLMCMCGRYKELVSYTVCCVWVFTHRLWSGHQKANFPRHEERFCVGSCAGRNWLGYAFAARLPWTVNASVKCEPIAK